MAALVAAVVFFYRDSLTDYPFINWDVAHFLYSGRMLADGRLLYLDWYTLNPPPMFFVGFGAHALSRVLSVSDIFVIHAAVLCLIGLGVTVLRRGMRRHVGDQVLATVLFAYVGASLYVVYWGPLYFGQREHLFFVLLLPLLLVRSVKGETAWLIPLGIFLGFFALMKPHFVFLLGVVEGLSLLRDRRQGARVLLRLWPAFCGGMSVLLLLLAHSPAAAKAMFTNVLQFHLQGSYDLYNEDYSAFRQIREHTLMVLSLVFGVAAVVVQATRRTLDAATARLLVLVPLLALLFVFHQSKFWAYHFCLFFGLNTVVVFYLLARGLEDERSERSAVVYPLVMAVLFFAGSLYELSSPFWEPPRRPLDQVGKLAPAGSRVMYFSPNMDFIYHPLYHQHEIVGPWSIHFHLPRIDALEGASRGEELQKYVGRIRPFIARDGPQFLFFAESRQAMRHNNAHGLLVTEGGLLRDQPYKPIDRPLPALRGWTVYERSAEAP